jgi:hypothetical protein
VVLGVGEEPGVPVGVTDGVTDEVTEGVTSGVPVTPEVGVGDSRGVGVSVMVNSPVLTKSAGPGHRPSIA